MGNRRRARILAFQALFSWEMNDVSLEDLLNFTWLDADTIEKYPEEVLLFARLLISGTIENCENLDEIITEQAEHWDIKRMNKVELSILRMSIYSLLYNRDISPTITINEALDIAKEFGKPESYRFVNGILDAVKKKQLPEQ